VLAGRADLAREELAVASGGTATHRVTLDWEGWPDLSQTEQSSETDVELAPSRHSAGRSALVRSPMRTRALLRLHWRRLVVVLVAVIALGVQVVLIWLAGELVDLCISLMEVWADLARKHLELTS